MSYYRTYPPQQNGIRSQAAVQMPSDSPNYRRPQTALEMSSDYSPYLSRSKATREELSGYPFYRDPQSSLEESTDSPLYQRRQTAFEISSDYFPLPLADLDKPADYPPYQRPQSGLGKPAPYPPYHYSQPTLEEPAPYPPYHYPLSALEKPADYPPYHYRPQAAIEKSSNSRPHHRHHHHHREEEEQSTVEIVEMSSDSPPYNYKRTTVAKSSDYSPPWDRPQAAIEKSSDIPHRNQQTALDMSSDSPRQNRRNSLEMSPDYSPSQNQPLTVLEFTPDYSPSQSRRQAANDYSSDSPSYHHQQTVLDISSDSSPDSSPSQNRRRISEPSQNRPRAVIEKRRDLPAIRVLVTGASGYLGLHCVKQLLDAGYTVRGTVRSVANEEKVKPIKDLDKYGRLELVEADLSQSYSWRDAVKGVDYILHVASPFPPPGTVNDTIVKTAIEGVINVFQAAAAPESIVKRIVLTSSIVSIAEGHKYDARKEFSENDWTDLKGRVTSYDKSKTLAERAAWDFVRDNKGHPFELAVINPSFIIGPLLSNVEGTSAGVIKRFLLNKVPAVPHIHQPSIDVRDCAKAHILAMTIPEAAGQRHIVTVQPSYWITDMAKDLAAEFRPLGYNISTRQAPGFVVRVLSICQTDLKAIAPRINQLRNFDTTRLRDVLGMTNLISPKTSVIDMGHSLIERGCVARTKQYKAPAVETLRL